MLAGAPPPQLLYSSRGPVHLNSSRVLKWAPQHVYIVSCPLDRLAEHQVALVVSPAPLQRGVDDKQLFPANSASNKNVFVVDVSTEVLDCDGYEPLEKTKAPPPPAGVDAANSVEVRNPTSTVAIAFALAKDRAAFSVILRNTIAALKTELRRCAR
jgi:hypothetical protein